MQLYDRPKSDLSIEPASARELQGLFDPAYPIFVLIDPMLGEPLPGIIIVENADGAHRSREAGWQRYITPIVLSRRVSMSPHLHPYLVQLIGSDDPLLAISLRLAHVERAQSQADGLDGEGGSAHRIGGWLHTSMHPDALALRIASMCDARAAGATNASYLRLVDRRTLGLLSQMPGADWLGNQFGRLRSWTFLDPTGQLATLQSSSEEPTGNRLTGENWRILKRAEVVNRALAQWLGELERNNRVPQLSTPEQYARFQVADSQAQIAANQWPHRFTGMHDLTTWAALSVLFPNLAASTAVRELMEDRGTPDQPAELMRYFHKQIGTVTRNAATTVA